MTHLSVALSRKCHFGDGHEKEFLCEEAVKRYEDEEAGKRYEEV